MVKTEGHSKKILSFTVIRFCAVILGVLLSQLNYGQPCNLSVNPGNNIPICFGASTQLIATPSGFNDLAQVTYSWSPVNGLNDPLIANPIANPISTTTYIVTVTEGACTSQNSVTITVNPSPDANFGTNTSVCSSHYIRLGATSVSGNTYLWTANPTDPTLTVANNTLSNPSVKPIQTTTYTLQETITATGCYKENNVTITVDPIPDADFTFTNNLTSCTMVQFTSSVNGSGNYNYSWNFGDGETSTEPNPLHEFHAYGNSGKKNPPYPVSLQVTDQLSGCLNDPAHQDVPVTLSPDPSFNITNSKGGTQFLSGMFLNCTSSSSNPKCTFQVYNGSTTTSSNTRYVIDWGDGNAPEEISNFTTNNDFASHEYLSLGFFNIVITVYNSVTGCSASKTYSFYSGNSPGGMLYNNGNTSDCAPYTITWDVLGTDNNPPGTTYVLSVNDGSPNVTYTQETLPKQISHLFTQTSCGKKFPTNAFTVGFSISNPCTTSFTSLSVKVTEKPVASFDKNTDSHICLNTETTFTDSSTGNYFLKDNCTSSYVRTWSITPETGWDRTAGAFGPSSSTSTSSIKVKFTATGNYLVQLKIHQSGSNPSRCTEDLMTMPICVEEPLIPQFSVDKVSGCAPLIVSATNSTNISKSCHVPFYLWEIVYRSGTCGTTAGYTFTNGTSASSANPSIQFTNPGTYDLTLTTGNSCDTITSPVKTITITQPPKVSLSAIASVCQTFPVTTINPVGTVSNCGSQPITYEWDFPGANTTTSSNASPGSINYALPGTYSLSLKATNECGSTTEPSNSFTITSSPTATISGTSDVCLNAAPPNVTLTGANGLAPYTFTYTINGGGNIVVKTSSGNSASVLSPTGLAGLFVYRLINVKDSNPVSCLQSQTGTATIQVNPLPTASISGTTSACLNGLSPLITFTGSKGTAPYTFTYNVNGAGIQTITTIAGNTVTLPVPTLNTGTFNYNLVSVKDASSTSCSQSQTGTASVTINQIPVYSPAPDQEFCNGAIVPVTPVTATYTWINSNTNIGLQASGTGNIPSFTATNTGNSPIFSTITVTPFANGCTGIPKSFTITVNPTPILTFSRQNETICSGDKSSLVTLSTPTSNATTEWAADPVPAGITGVTILSGTTTIPEQTLLNATDKSLTITYRAKAKSTGYVTCEGSTLTYTITIKPKPKIVDSQTTICTGSTTSVNPINGGSNIVPSGTNYTWSSPVISPGGAITGGSAQNVSQGIINVTLINTTNDIATATYTVTPNANGCIGNPFTVIVTVNPKDQVEIPAAQIVCSGQSTIVDFTSLNIGGTTYSWFNDNPNIGLAPAGTGNIAFNATNAGTAPITANLTVFPTYSYGGLNCQSSHQQFHITVNPNGQVNIPVLRTFCNGQNAVIKLTTSNTVGSTTYSWTNNNTGIGLLASGNTDQLSFTAQNSGTTPIVATIAVTPTFDNGGKICEGPITQFDITVNPDAQVNNLGPQVTCSSQSVPVNFTTTNSVGITTYSWTNDNAKIGLPTFGNGNLLFVTQNPENTAINATITVTPTFSYRNVSCTGPSKQFEISVNPLPSVIFTPADQPICSGDKTALVTLSSETLDVNFSWTAVVPNGITGAALSGTGTIPEQVLFNTTSTPLMVIYKAKGVLKNFQNCEGPEYIYTITVNPIPKIVTNISTNTCSGNSFSVSPSNGNGNIVPVGIKYKWDDPVINPSGLITGGSVQSTPQTTISQTLVNTTNSVATATYRVTPIANGCSGQPFEAVVSVNPETQVDTPVNQFVCPNDLTTVNFTTSNLGGVTTYSWTNNNSSIGLAASGSGNISFTTKNATTSPLTATITVTPTYSLGGENCQGMPKQFTITVNPVGQMNIPAIRTFCNSQASQVVFGTANTGGTTTYSWTNNNPSIGLPDQGSGDLTFTANNPGSAPITATIKVTPTFTNKGVSCTGPFTLFDITINPSAQVNGINDQIFCKSQSATINFTTSNTIGSTTYTWTNDNPNIGLPSSGNGNISFIANNSGASPNTATITVTPNFSFSNVNCSGPSKQFFITVNPSPDVVFIPATQTICSAYKTNLVSLTSSTLNVDFTWTATIPSTITGATANGTGDIPVQTLMNTTTAPVNVVYKARAQVQGGGACQGIEYTYVITVNPTPNIVKGLSATICSDLSFSVAPTNGNGNIVPTGTTYIWDAPLISPSSDAIVDGKAEASPKTIISQKLTNTTNTLATATYSVTPIINGCVGNPFEVVVTVNPTVNVNDLNDISICSGSKSTLIDFSGDVAGTTYNWTNNVTSIGLAASGTGNIPSFTAINSGTTPIIATITVTPKANNCFGLSKTFKITVNPIPNTNPINDILLCNNQLSNIISFTGKVAGTSFNWINDTPSIGLAGNGIGNVPAFTAVNARTSLVSATITIVPNANNCTDLPTNFKINVQPVAHLTTNPLVQTICSGTKNSAIDLTSDVIGATFSWSVNASPGITGFTPSGNGTTIIASTIKSTLNIPGTVNYIITPFIGTCAGVPSTYTITVNPSPTVTNNPLQTVCSESPTAPVLLTSNVSGTTFAWIVTPTPSSTVSGYLSSGTSTIDIQNIKNTGIIQEEVKYHIIPTSDIGLSCPGTPVDYVIKINPLPVATATPLSQVACSDLTPILTLSSSLGNTSFNWTIESNTGNITGATSGNGSSIAQILKNSSNTIAGKIVFKILPDNGLCTGKPIYPDVIVNPRPLPTITGDIVICQGSQGVIYTTEPNMLNYIWNISSGGTITAGSGTNEIKVTWNGLGGQTVSVNYLNSFGCDALSPTLKTVTVYPNLPVSVAIAPDANNICPGTKITFSAFPVNGGMNPGYLWKVNGTITGSNSPSFSYSPVNGDKIDCQLTSNAICPTGNPAQSNVVTMVVYSNLPASISIVASTDNVCPGDTITFTATPFNEGFTPVYQWFVNGAKVGTNNPVFSYAPVNLDVVTCQLTSSNLCASKMVVLSNALKMAVAMPPVVPRFEIIRLNDCAPIDVLLKNISPTNGNAYIWNFGDGESKTTTTAVDLLHTYQNFTSDTKSLQVTLKIITSTTHCFIVLAKPLIVEPEIIAGSPVSFQGCSPFTTTFENAYPGAKSYRWVAGDKKTVLSTALKPTLTFEALNKKDTTHLVYLIAESARGCFDTIVNTVKVSPPLVTPSFSYSGTPECKVVTYTFNNTSPEGPTLFVWDFDDGTINKTAHANEILKHTFRNGLDIPVTYNVTLTSNSGSFCSMTVAKKITVNPEFTAGFPVTFQACNPVIRTFDNAYPGAKTYQWKGSDGKLLSNKLAPELTFSIPIGKDSTFKVLLIAESLSGCIDTVVNTIIVRSATKAEFTNTPSEGCSPLTVQFNAATSSLIKGYEWNFGDNSDFSILQNPRHLFIDPNGSDTKYKVRLLAYNQYGCADTISHEIHLLPTPQVDFTASPLDQVYPNTTVQLNNLTPAGNWTYTWDLNDQKPLITGSLTSYTYSFPGNYIISLNAKNTASAQCARTKYIEVVINPGIPVAAFEPDTSGCAPLKVTFRNFSRNSSRYLWDFGNGIQSTEFSPTKTFYDEGTYNVILNAFNQFGVKAVAEHKVVIHPIPKALFKPLPNRVKIPGQEVTFANYSLNGQDYLWNFGDGKSSIDFRPVHPYTETGIFNVTLYVTSTEGCKDTLALLNAVEAFSDALKVPNAFMPDKTGPSGGNFDYGNPSNHIFYPVVPPGDVVEYEFLIYNRWGNLVFVSKEVQRGWDGYYNDKLCSQDVYIWKIRCKYKSGEIVTKTGDVTLIR